MGVAQLITAVGLQAGGVERAMHFAGLSVEIEVADRVRGEMLFALAAKGGDLKIQIPGGFLISERRCNNSARFDFRCRWLN